MSTQLQDAMPAEMQAFRLVAASMARLLLQVKLFPQGHPSIEAALTDTQKSLDDMLAGRKSIIFRPIRDSLCYMNFELNTGDIGNRKIHILQKAIMELSIREIEFVRGVERDEIIALMELFVSVLNKDRSFDLGAAWSRIRNIRTRYRGSEPDAMLPVEAARNRNGHGDTPSKDPMQHTQNRDHSGIGEVIGGLLDKLEKIQSMEGRYAARMILDLIENEGSNHSIVLLMKSLKDYDDYTFAHSVNVAVISTATANHIGFSEDEVAMIGLSALMHDVGKLYVPKEIIKKMGRLTPEEWQKIKKHPVDGDRILREEGIDERICRVAYEHHIRYDLRGYPPVDSGREILPASHIVRIADTYDALTTKRAYRKQISPFEAIKLMTRTRGTEFHPGYFDYFLHMMGNIPIGSTLILESGETALVVDINRGAGLLPRVRILRDAEGMEVCEERIIDLNEIDPWRKKYRYRIKEVVDDPVRNIEIGKYLVPGHHE